ncbi:hypothetical protein Tco_1165413, partial [Tanacetum coccineum]
MWRRRQDHLRRRHHDSCASMGWCGGDSGGAGVSGGEVVAQSPVEMVRMVSPVV